MLVIIYSYFEFFLFENIYYDFINKYFFVFCKNLKYFNCKSSLVIYVEFFGINTFKCK